MDDLENKIENKEEIKKEEQVAVNAEPAVLIAPPVPPLEVTASVPAPKKKKGIAGKVVCLAICCTLTGAALGAGGVIAFNAFHRGPGRFGRVMYESALRGDEAGSQGRKNYGRKNSDGNSDNRQKFERGDRDRNSSNNYQNGKGSRGQSDSNRKGQNNRGSGQQNLPNPPGNGNNNQAPNDQIPNGQTPNGQQPADNGQAPDATPAPSDNNGTANG